MAKVSVLVPIYNVEKYLKECLASICRQSMDDIEIICIDDGSTDSSWKILEEFSEQDKRFHAVHQKNSGYGAALNLALSMASGEYVGIVESDDFIEPTMYDELYCMARKQEADIVYANYYKCSDKNGEVFFEELKGMHYDIPFSPLEDIPFITRKPKITSGIYRLDFLREHNIVFLQTPGASYQDTSFGFKTLLSAHRVVLTKRAYLHYRIDNVNSSIHDKGKLYNVCDEMDEVFKFMENEGINDACVYNLLCQMRYMIYRWNLNRLKDELKVEFLPRMIDDFRKLYERGNIDLNYWSNLAYVEELQELISDAGKYSFHILDRLAYPHILCDLVYYKSKEASNLYIYGAGASATDLFWLLRDHEIDISGFVVTDGDKNPDVLWNRKVYSYDSFKSIDDKKCMILISVAKRNQYSVYSSLLQDGYANILMFGAEIIAVN